MKQNRQQYSQDDMLTGLARVVMHRADALAAISEEPGRLTRRFATPAMRQANETVAGWMREAGMSVHRDNIGNLIGRYESSESDEQNRAQSKSSTLILGSHLDTVRDAGKYDGPLGVLVAIACVERMRAAKRRMPFTIEVAAFADEEGLRYSTSYLGSKVFAGRFDPKDLDLVDGDGISMREAIAAFGGDPTLLSGDKRRASDLLGYCEVHIEQGPILEMEGLPVGVVSAIAGQTRVAVQFTGKAGHAGTVPLEARRDALCAAAEFVLTVERLALEASSLVATVGQLSLHPGASNVIPGKVSLSLDVRHAEDSLRREAVGQLQEHAAGIGRQREIEVEWQVLHETPAIATSPSLTEKLAQAVRESGVSVRYLVSGAGHDAVIMSDITPVSMLFVRCKGGVSHNPAESVAVEDVAVAIDVMGRFLEIVAGDRP